MAAFQKTLNRYLNGSNETQPWGLTFPVLTWPNIPKTIYQKIKKNKTVKIFNQDNIWNNIWHGMIRFNFYSVFVCKVIGFVTD